MNDICKAVQKDWAKDLRYLKSLKEDETSYTRRDIKNFKFWT